MPDAARNSAVQPASQAIGTAERCNMPSSTSRKLEITRPTTHIPPSNRLGFEVAIICALPIEADAVISLLDEHWEKGTQRYGKAAKDPNAYTAGRIGHHNVVVVHMPSMGKINAAGAAQGLRSSYQNIQLALVIGICGAVPQDRRSGREIFLGDVIISRGLIQYEFGRQYPTVFEAKDSLEGGCGKPPAEIRSILAKLETRHHRRLLELNTDLLLRGLQAEAETSAYPGPYADKLFDSSSLHKHRKSCQTCESEGSFHICSDAIHNSCEDLGCETDGLVRRTRGKTHARPAGTVEGWSYSPSIHIGNMGSGDTVMKSAAHRDEVARKYDIIGFEMEGSGICDFFPTLVIKGVCDYADSHKNKKWQMYAAATAAATTKAFLEEWRPKAASPVDTNLH
ncbi:uncharacterized protein A1O5_07266 [Cladophialophora psammophila CBS 110553]|uniref:Nucleoside phosphorylase domain-containing protein n=1 Tax=Cladophialophora psammophila CBS 110553 TaxID=1182543 RepID=W9WVY4_9EURO|nr:uncharacterized protein A1O5_07266 [Cladophialophora psammophila CBS 110553]EXJ69230.1 hypothetical protein A1O5_07266 [Cladophialophora psammophila CBS 110553]